jgi:hypothetical protein
MKTIVLRVADENEMAEAISRLDPFQGSTPCWQSTTVAEKRDLLEAAK